MNLNFPHLILCCRTTKKNGGVWHSTNTRKTNGQAKKMAWKRICESCVLVMCANWQNCHAAIYFLNFFVEKNSTMCFIHIFNDELARLCIIDFFSPLCQFSFIWIRLSPEINFCYSCYYQYKENILHLTKRYSRGHLFCNQKTIFNHFSYLVIEESINLICVSIDFNINSLRIHWRVCKR